MVHLHGIADNRSSAGGLAATFPARGFDLIAFDSRAHGDSEGDACTYGYYERRDLQRILGGIERGPIVVIGVSLGAAVGLERAPFFVTGWMARQAFARAEAVASFDVDAIDLVAGAGHSQSLGVPEVWTEINEWIDRTVPRPNP